MMIHINLLPVRQEKKREVGRQFLVVVGGALFITLLGNWLWYDGLASEEKKNAQRMAATQARIAALEKVIGEVDKINARKKDVQAKLAILADLRKQRTGPVRMLDALSTAIPKKVWLNTFDEKTGAVKMTGRAVSHEDVAEFMRALQSIVWTPRGMGRLIEQKRDSANVRVELVGGEGAVDDFPSKSISNFFTRVELKKAESKAPGQGAAAGAPRIVEFEINMTANYAI
ncbi:MAG TPA: PilN domain-containing protein [Myxococcaceae bacterium]|nr:PilN domain-containing protein [Myxococcaceae bacterium]